MSTPTVTTSRRHCGRRNRAAVMAVGSSPAVGGAGGGKIPIMVRLILTYSLTDKASIFLAEG